MAALDFHGFDWDQGNAFKNLKKHGLEKEAIEALLRSEPYITDDTRHSGLESRFVAVGLGGKGRWMMVAFTIRLKEGARYLRPISARYMHAKEVKRYEENR